MGPVLLIWTSVSIYHALTAQEDLPAALHKMSAATKNSRSVLYVLAAIGMMPVNWLLETWKWYVLIRREGYIRFRDCMRAVLGGLALSMNTPNRIGEYFGRILYLEKGKRFSGANYFILSGMAQLLMTMTAGWIAILLLPARYMPAGGHTPLLDLCFAPLTRMAVFSGCIVLLLLYFNYAAVLRYVSGISVLKRFTFLQAKIPEVERSILIRILWISMIRFMIFTTQYILIWQAFGITFDMMQAAAVVSLIYLIMAVIPTIAIAELGIRGKVALLVAGVYTDQWLEVTAGTVIIWLLNLILPAVIGTLFLWNLKWNRTK